MNPVTYTNVAELSKEMIPKGKEFIQTPFGQMNSYMSITSNIAKRINKKRIAKILNLTSITRYGYRFRKIKPNRNLDNLQRKYMKLSKKELVQRLNSCRTIYCRK